MVAESIAKSNVDVSKSKATTEEEDEEEIDREVEKANMRRARLLGKDDMYYFFVGGVGALFAGIIFPSKCNGKMKMS